MKLEELNSKYEYVSDKTQYSITERWVVMKQVEGKLKGDCEDYCLTLKKYVAEFEEWDLYYCKLQGVGHCVLSNGTMIIDCNCRQPLLKETYCKIYDITNLKKYNVLTILSKFLFSKIFLGIHKWTS